MLKKTAKGAEVLQNRSIALPPRQRTLLLLANGERSAAELLGQTAGLSAKLEDIEALISAGLLVEEQPAFSSSVQTLPLPPQIDTPTDTTDLGELNDLRVAAFKARDGESTASRASMPLSTNLPSYSSDRSLQSAQRSTQSFQSSFAATNLPGDANLAPMTDAERFDLAYRTATKLSSELGLKAFRLQLSLEKSGTLDELRDLRPKLFEALKKESGEGEALKRIRPLDRLLRHY